MSKLLIVDDEPAILFSIEQALAGTGCDLLCASSADQAVDQLVQHAPQVVLMDICLGTGSGLDLLNRLRELDPQVMVIFMTGHGNSETAIEAMKRGAYDYLVKPLDLERLRKVVKQALTICRLMRIPASIDEADHPEERPDRLVGSGPQMQMACKQIGRVAPQDVNVLILGESGTGKELAARAIFQHSRRSRAPFLAINCAAIPESLLESELFGHERGAFTGADQRRIGKFEQCHGGTLFLDEIGDMAPGTQAKILRLLQEGRFQRVGGSETLAVDVRILAATNHNLTDLIEKGLFRKDLYYRLRGVTIHLPPLRERREDIAELAHYFLFRFNRQLGTTVSSITPEALTMLEKYDWPGNVRELQSVIREALICSAGTALLPEFLPAELQCPEPFDETINGVEGVDDDWQSLIDLVEQSIAQRDRDIYRRALAIFDRLLITRAMQKAGGQQIRAAEMLGLSRVTLRAKLRAMHMEVEKVLLMRQ